jgi:putative hydrolase of the HAD superfamily
MAAPGDSGARPFKAIIFDCFGVLYVDNKTSLLATVPFERQKELNDVFLGNNYGYFDRAEYLRRVSEVVGLSVEEVSEYMADEHRLNAQLTALISEQLHGEYKIGLLSNIGRGWIHDFFDRHQLYELFDEVVLSGEEGVAKPSPEIFQLMAERLGLATNDCLMIDDILENCEGAERAGMQAIHYQDNAQLFDALYELKVLA